MQGTTARRELEGALVRTQGDADASLKAATAVAKSLKRFRALVHDGNLRELKAGLAAVEQSMAALQEQVEATADGWEFDEDDYFSRGGYTQELLETAESLGVDMFEQDERLYCYPSLIQVLPNERTLLIDRVRERRLRPALVIEQLRRLHERGPRFRPEAFVEVLFKAYRALAQRHGAAALQRGPVERLADVYDLLTLLPGRDYSRQEFARDLYLLDRSGITTTRGGYAVSFPASTGTKSATGVLTAIGENGQERRYWGIAFSREV
ncbi:MAG: hypothetical protein JO057_10555 [Chloroflexi bacterium]|nr:hypothetical protein [Chloroflexota bacterium]